MKNELEQAQKLLFGVINERATSPKEERQRLIKEYKIPDIKILKGYGDRFKLNDYKPSQKLFDEIGKYETRLAKIKKEQADFKESLENTLSKCNTLKQFLDVWADGEQLIPEEVMERYNTETVKPAAREEIDPEITNKLSSVLMRRKIGDAIHK